MSATLQLEEVTQLHDAPRLLVEWSSPWDEFVTSIRPALSRSTARLAGEAPFGLIPYRIMLAACALELFLIFCAVIVPIKLAQLHPYMAPKLANHDIIYYSGDELPRTEDLGGTHAGAEGRAGGTEAHHRTQTIKVARGGSMVEKVLDAPRLKLAPSSAAVANLLAIRPDAGPPPTEGMRSSRAVPNLPSSVIAPVPSLTSDLSRNAVSLGSVIPPAPSVSRDRVLIAPALSTSVVAPAPTVSSDRTRSTPALATSVIPPAPEAARDRHTGRALDWILASSPPRRVFPGMPPAIRPVLPRLSIPASFHRHQPWRAATFRARLCKWQMQQWYRRRCQPPSVKARGIPSWPCRLRQWSPRHPLPICHRICTVWPAAAHLICRRTWCHLRPRPPQALPT